jgi:transcriptional regulator with XRE-family HTH domain
MQDRRDLLSGFRQRLDVVIHESALGRSEFAEKAGIDRSTLSQLLSDTNRRLPRIETLAAIAESQQVSIDWLLGLSQQGPLGADIVNETMSIEQHELGPTDQRLIAWLNQAIGYKIRYVPTTLPDLLKTEEVIRYELRDFVSSRPEQKIETAAGSLAWTRRPETDFECCLSLQAIESFARGENIWKDLDHETRVAQLDHMADLIDETYPTVRIFLFDGLERYAAPMTIFGPLRAAIYLGQMFLVLTSTEHVRALISHFDGLIRGATVQPNEASAFIRDLRKSVRRSR